MWWTRADSSQGWFGMERNEIPQACEGKIPISRVVYRLETSECHRNVGSANLEGLRTQGMFHLLYHDSSYILLKKLDGKDSRRSLALIVERILPAARFSWGLGVRM